MLHFCFFVFWEEEVKLTYFQGTSATVQDPSNSGGFLSILTAEGLVRDSESVVRTEECI
jgi:hypothetical protein